MSDATVLKILRLLMSVTISLFLVLLIWFLMFLPREQQYDREFIMEDAYIFILMSVMIIARVIISYIHIEKVRKEK